MKKETTKTADIDFAESAVPQSSRRNMLTMFMIMLGFILLRQHVGGQGTL